MLAGSHGSDFSVMTQSRGAGRTSTDKGRMYYGKRNCSEGKRKGGRLTDNRSLKVDKKLFRYYNQYMKKKLIITAGAIVAVIILLIVLSFTVFTLKKVEFVFLDEESHTIDPPSGFSYEDALGLASEFIGNNIVFVDEEAFIRKFTDNLPEYKCLDIKRSFPDSLAVYLAERKQVFYIADSEGSGGYITDEDLFVFKTFENSLPRGVRILGLSEDIMEIKVGGEIVLREDSVWKGEVLKVVAQTLWRLGYSFGSQADFLNNAVIKAENGGVAYTLELETSLGGRFIISNPTNNLENRIIAVYGVLTDSGAAKDADYIVDESGQIIDEVPH